VTGSSICFKLNGLEPVTYL